MPHALYAASALAALALTATAAAAAPATPYDGAQRTSLYIPSADGTRLAIDVYRPTRGGVVATEKLPVIFTQDRTPARNRGGMRDDFTSHGYVWVAQDRRGEGASFGVQKGFITRDDRKDGKAVVEWAARQPWSTGKVGSVGCSNQGAHQYTLAAEAPKHLVAIAPECASPTFFDTTQSPNGVSSFAQGTTAPYHGECEDPQRVGAPVDADKDGTLAKAAAAEHRCNAKFLGQYEAHMHRDTLQAYLGYRPGLVDSVAHQAAAVRASGVQILNVGGWFDASPMAALQAWQIWGGHVVIGPWTHCGANGPTPEFADSKFDRAALNLRWYDHTLKGQANGFGDEAPIYYYTMNAPAGREWRYAAQWPLPNQQLTKFYLGAGKSGAVASLNDGGLTKAPPGATGSDVYKPDYSADLFEGKYQILGRFWTGDMRKGTDEKGLTYTLAPLTADLQVTGHPTVHLWVTSTAPDEDFFAIIEDVAPDGRSTYVTDGKMRASRRKLGTPPWGDLGLPWHPQMTADDQPLSAANPAELAFDILPTSYVFKAGHRIRLTLINSGGKSFQPIPGQDRAHPPTITILRDAAHPSFISLPVIPQGSSLYAGKAKIDAGAVHYDGPAELYVAGKATYLRYGGQWMKFEGGGRSGAFAAKGAQGPAQVTLAGGSATLAGKSIRFSGAGA